VHYTVTHPPSPNVPAALLQKKHGSSLASPLPLRVLDAERRAAPRDDDASPACVVAPALKKESMPATPGSRPRTITGGKAQASQGGGGRAGAPARGPIG